jgi:hypothetical protein
MPESLCVVWALPRCETNRLNEQPLISFPVTLEQALRVRDAAKVDGWHSFRFAFAQETDTPPDFTKAVSRG